MARTFTLIALALTLAGCACCAPPPTEPDFSRPLGHYDDGHMLVIVLGTIPHKHATEYALHLDPAERPTTLLDAALLRDDGEPVTPLHPVEQEAQGQVRIHFPRTEHVTHLGVRYESPNGVRRVLLVPVQR